MNISSLRDQGSPGSTNSRYKNNRASGNNDRNEDDTRNLCYTISRWRTAEHILEDTDNRNNALISLDTDSHLHGSSNSKCVDEDMDKTRSYVWENPREVKENEISGSFSPVTGARSRDIKFDSGSRGNQEGEMHKTRHQCL